MAWFGAARGVVFNNRILRLLAALRLLGNGGTLGLHSPCSIAIRRLSAPFADSVLPLAFA